MNDLTTPTEDAFSMQISFFFLFTVLIAAWLAMHFQPFQTTNVRSFVQFSSVLSIPKLFCSFTFHAQKKLIKIHRMIIKLPFGFAVRAIFYVKLTSVEIIVWTNFIFDTLKLSLVPPPSFPFTVEKDPKTWQVLETSCQTICPMNWHKQLWPIDAVSLLWITNCNSKLKLKGQEIISTHGDYLILKKSNISIYLKYQ